MISYQRQSDAAKVTVLALGASLGALVAGCAATVRPEQRGVSGYSAAAMDRDMVYVPGGSFLYGMTQEEKQATASVRTG